MPQTNNLRYPPLADTLHFAIAPVVRIPVYNFLNTFKSSL
jgi:hypothetical protein